MAVMFFGQGIISIGLSLLGVGLHKCNTGEEGERLLSWQQP